jgi:hypothetical protein
MPGHLDASVGRRISQERVDIGIGDGFLLPDQPGA